MGEKEELKAKFLSAYANLPAPERVQVVAIIDGKTHSWDAAYMEINSDSELGKNILKKMKYVGIL